jgi:Tol biopolymer transport system component
VLSGDGHFAVFAGDQSLYRYDFDSGVTELLLQSEPLEVNSYSYELPVISYDGRYIAFRETKRIGGFDSKLIRVIDTTVAEDNITTIGPVENNSYDLSMSPNGRYISFITSTSSYPDRAPPDAWEDAYDLYVWVRTIDTVEMASDEQTEERI